MKPLEVRMLPLDQLIPAEYNPRKVSAAAYRKLKASLETFGLVEPLVWNERSGHVVGGHQRLAILRDLGICEVPVSVVNLSDTEEKSLNIVLNNLEAQGRYDPEKLAEILAELEPLQALEATGFSAATLKALKLVPRDRKAEADNGGEEIEITLTTDRLTYEAISPRLDAIIREYDLASHVRETHHHQ